MPPTLTSAPSPPAASLKIAAATINPTLGDLPGNTSKILAAVEKARQLGANVVVTPELALCGSPPEDLILNPDFLAACEHALNDLVEKIEAFGDISLIVGHPVSLDGALYNAATVLRSGLAPAVYCKILLSQEFGEPRYFSQGNAPLVVDIAGVACGINIGEDIFQEHPARLTRAAGAELLLVLAASSYHIGKPCERLQSLASRVRENGFPALYVNLVGGQDELVFDGGAFAFDHTGKIAAHLPRFQENLLLCATLLQESVAKRGVGWDEVKQNPCNVPQMLGFHCAPSQPTAILPLQGEGEGKPSPSRGGFGWGWGSPLFHANLQGTCDCPMPSAEAAIHPDISLEEEVWQALTLGIRDYVEKNRFPGILLGFSGGIDSALALALAVDALGKERVRTVIMPSPYTSQMSLDDASAMTRALGTRHEEIGIEPVMHTFANLLAPSFAGMSADTTEENIQARARGMILMALSNKNGELVLTAGNKSEMAVGYCTLYGDMAGGFAVLKDVPKTMVYRLARYRNQQEPGVIPENIIRRPPSAELKPGQTDQDSLPPYEILDAIIEGYMEKNKSVAELIRDGLPEEDVTRAIRLFHLAEYKRHQAPVGILVTARGFGRNWRYPITNRWRSP